MQPMCLICCASGALIDKVNEPWGVAGLWLPIALLCKFLCLHALHLQWRWGFRHLAYIQAYAYWHGNLIFLYCGFLAMTSDSHAIFELINF